MLRAGLNMYPVRRDQLNQDQGSRKGEKDKQCCKQDEADD